ncbi:hypothetical protein Vi05172_g13194 [Venturia inaequalis]|nr:hypothetical protein Vi05172_g13194 [Venturia inaequalis]
MRPKQIAIANVALPGLWAAVIAPDVELAVEVGEAVAEACIVTVVVPVTVETILTDFFSEKT